MRLMIFVAATCLATFSFAKAQNRPPFPPATPYDAQVSFSNGMSGTFRYQNGKLRVDAISDAGPSTAYVDLSSRQAIIIMSMQGMNMALDVDLNELHIPDLGNTASERVGSDMVAGEACDLWRLTDPKTGKTGVACVTQDGIPLRAGEDGAASPAMVVQQVRRGPQNASDLVPPQGLMTIKATGLGNLPFAIPGLGQ